MLYVNQYPANMSVQLSLNQLDQTIAQLKSRWNEFVPGQPFQYSFLKNDWEAKYRQEQRTGTIFRIFSILAIFIACLGLLGLASFMAEQRTKEIGVRKVFGASVTSIMGILSKEVVILIGISTLVAWPAAYYFMNGWLRDFAYRIELSLLTFILASLAAFGIALLTIGHRAYKSAVANPAESLKDE
jgi:putative ABC transport system permease protein